MRWLTRAPGRPTGPFVFWPLPVALDQPGPGPSFVRVCPVKSARVSAAAGGSAAGGGVSVERTLAAGRAMARRGLRAVGLGGSAGGAGGALGGATVISTIAGGRLRGAVSP